jgi:hypothetical protein
MKLSSKQKRLVREKVEDKYGKSCVILYIRSLQLKPYEHEGEATIKVCLQEHGSDKESYMFTRLQYLHERVEKDEK